MQLRRFVLLSLLTICLSPKLAFADVLLGATMWADAGFVGTVSNGSVKNLIGDVNGDLRDDLVAIDTNGVRVRTSTGTVFNNPTTWLNVAFYGNAGLGTFLADVDADGDADLLVSNVSSGVVVRLSNGSSGFGSPVDMTNGTPWYGNAGTFFADVTGDGRADAISVVDDPSWGGVYVRVGYNDFGTPKFGSSSQWVTGNYYGNVGTIVRDVDLDGRADIVAVNTSGWYVKLSTGSSFGSTSQYFSGNFTGNAFVGLMRWTASTCAYPEPVAFQSSSPYAKGLSWGFGWSWAGPEDLSTSALGSQATLVGRVLTYSQDVFYTALDAVILLNANDVMVRVPEGLSAGGYPGRCSP